jgi:hypothetical protein
MSRASEPTAIPPAPIRPDAPRLSVVAVSRNDDHGGDLRGRMQHFVDGFIAQCRRHGLAAELIMVEWNPPPDRPPLEQALRWPGEFGPATVRIVTVPAELHAAFPHASALPLFQMIGKNVGIRRARGAFVLATNIDILLDDALVCYLRDRLQPGTVLRVDRYDVPAELSAPAPFERLIADCAARFFQVGTRFGIFDVRQRRFLGLGTRLEASLMSLAVGLRILGAPYRVEPVNRLLAAAAHTRVAAAILAAALRRMAAELARYVRNVVPLRRLPIRLYYLLRRLVVGTGRQIARLVRLVVGLAVVAASRLAAAFRLRGANDPARMRLARSRWLHCWACGDFTLLAREDWFSLRGYPEWPMYSWHIDSVFMYAANAHDLRQVALGPRYRAYHIDHSSGWSPDGERELFARLDAKGIPYLRDADLRRWQHRFAKDPASAIVNGPDWGLAGHRLPERCVLPGGRVAAATGAAATRRC